MSVRENKRFYSHFSNIPRNGALKMEKKTLQTLILAIEADPNCKLFLNFNFIALCELVETISDQIGNPKSDFRVPRIISRKKWI